MQLVPALLPDFGIGLCTSFCLALILALCKDISFGPSIEPQLKKHKTNGVPRGPIIQRHVAH